MSILFSTTKIQKEKIKLHERKNGKFWSISLGHFIKHNPLISEEVMCNLLFISGQNNFVKKVSIVYIAFKIGFWKILHYLLLYSVLREYLQPFSMNVTFFFSLGNFKYSPGSWGNVCGKILSWLIVISTFIVISSSEIL